MPALSFDGQRRHITAPSARAIGGPTLTLRWQAIRLCTKYRVPANAKVETVEFYFILILCREESFRSMLRYFPDVGNLKNLHIDTRMG